MLRYEFMVLHCLDCGWRSEVTLGIAAAVCPECGKRRLEFLRFDELELATLNGILRDNPVTEDELHTARTRAQRRHEPR